MKITFKEDSHQYFDENGVEYQSVTKMLHNYSQPFDKYKMSELVARKRGITQTEVLAEWDAANKHACDYGTAVHLLMENYIKKREMVEGNESLYESFDAILKEYLPTHTEILSEIILWDKETRVAGTSDLVFELPNDEFVVGDFKTNKALNYFSKYNSYLKYPVEHLTDCNYSIYCLQLSIYALMRERITGKKCRNVFLLYRVGDEWKYIPADYMKYEAMAVLKHWKLQGA